MTTTTASSDGTTVSTSRRGFLKTTAVLAAPYFVPGASLGLAGSIAPSERITLGCIGLGIHGMGWNLDTGFLKFDDAKVLAVCDCYADRREAGRRMVNERYGDDSCTSHADWRELIARDDLDAIVVSTPDHWHTVMAAAASKAGKDVCCEKPTLTIAEGRELIDIVRANGTVFQTATEDRSIPQYHRMAELVRNGRIGKLRSIRISLPRGRLPEAPREGAIPAGFDYDMWLGPAPEAPYYTNRCGPQEWRSIADYSGGKFTDWGAHMLDTAQWAMDTERSGPTRVEAHGVFPDEWSLFSEATDFLVRYEYPSGVEVVVTSGGTGMRCEGTEGWLEVPKWRAPLRASDKRIVESVIGPEETRLFTCPGGEHRNFLDCVRTRQDPYFPVEVGHAVSTMLHVANIAMKLDRPLGWDPETERFDDDEANAMRWRPRRAPWTV